MTVEAKDEDLTPDTPVFSTDVQDCVRCGGTHFGMRFKKFTSAPPGWTHFGLCPITEEPILMEVSADVVVTPIKE